MGSAKNRRKPKKKQEVPQPPPPPPLPKKPLPKPRPINKKRASQESSVQDSEAIAAATLASLREIAAATTSVAADEPPRSQAAGDGIPDGPVLHAARELIGECGFPEEVEEVEEDGEGEEDEGEEEVEVEEDDRNNTTLADKAIKAAIQAFLASKSQKPTANTSTRHFAEAAEPSDDDSTTEEESYDICFKIPCGQAVQEVRIRSDVSWKFARDTFARKMGCEPLLIRLAYILPWEQKGGRKPAPTLLQHEDEWNSLKEQVDAHIKAEKSKNRGHGHAITDLSESKKTSKTTSAVNGIPPSSVQNKEDAPQSKLAKIALSKWANMVMLGSASMIDFPKQLIPDLGPPITMCSGPGPTQAAAEGDPALHGTSSGTTSGPGVAGERSAAAPPIAVPGSATTVPTANLTSPQTILHALMMALNPSLVSSSGSSLLGLPHGAAQAGHMLPYGAPMPTAAPLGLPCVVPTTSPYPGYPPLLPLRLTISDDCPVHHATMSVTPHTLLVAMFHLLQTRLLQPLTGVMNDGGLTSVQPGPIVAAATVMTVKALTHGHAVVAVAGVQAPVLRPWIAAMDTNYVIGA
ncbi:hypothetical protein GY45DRAFT_1340526 [Cubamyces sp. BRFM 1775]|nr:hypothetical protein GY45DRAFT_1340526 [Cubamyces sp. BRFM 1775]